MQSYREVYPTWHSHIEISERDFSSSCPFESLFVFYVGKTCPEILLWSQAHQTDQEGIFISAWKHIKTEGWASQFIQNEPKDLYL